MSDTIDNELSTDVLVIGNGLMGAVIARLVREQHPDAHILIADAGLPIGDPAGQHLHQSTDEAIRARYLTKVSTGIQALYTGAEVTPAITTAVADIEPGMYNLSAFGSDSAAMPAAAVAWNSGGMGIHWTAACPTPWGSEVPDFVDQDQWSIDLDTAHRLLQVHDDAFGITVGGRAILRELEDAFGEISADGRHPRTMPMAVDPQSPARARTGPSAIFPPIAGESDDHFTLLSGWQCRRIDHQDGVARGAVLRDVSTGREIRAFATIVVVCADVLRTPQILFASDIRPDALGKRINEHAILSGRVFIDTAELGIDEGALPDPQPGEWALGSYWLPQSGESQPFHGQMMERRHYDEQGKPLAYSLSLGWYIPTETREDNRLEFSDSEFDVTGMPHTTVYFDYTPKDHARIDEARASQVRAGSRIGSFDPETDSALLAPGSSLHMTGSVRMGTDRSDSVCDTNSRVWGFENLYVAGNGVVPTAVVGNSTLTAAIFAVGAARAINSQLSARVSA